MKLLLRTLCVLTLLVCARAAHAQAYQIVGTETSTVAGNLTRTVTTVQAGPNPIDRFLITRVFKHAEGRPSKGTLLFSTRHLHEVEHPILAWLRRKVR